MTRGLFSDHDASKKHHWPPVVCCFDDGLQWLTNKNNNLCKQSYVSVTLCDRKLIVIIQFIFCYQTLFSGLISARLRHFANNSRYRWVFGHWDVRLALSLVHQIGGCAGQDRFDLLEKRARHGPDAYTKDETADWHPSFRADLSMRLMCIWTAPSRFETIIEVVLTEDALSRTGGGRCFIVLEPS